MSKKCFCGHSREDHGKYIANGKNAKGSRLVCQVDGCHLWAYCDLADEKIEKQDIPVIHRVIPKVIHTKTRGKNPNVDNSHLLGSRYYYYYINYKVLRELDNNKDYKVGLFFVLEEILDIFGAILVCFFGPIISVVEMKPPF